MKLKCITVPVKIYPLSEEHLTGKLDNFERMLAINGSLYIEAFRDNTQIFASHMIEGFFKKKS